MSAHSCSTPLSQIALYHLVRRSFERRALRQKILAHFETDDGTFLSIPVARRARIQAPGQVIGARVSLLSLLSLKAIPDRWLPNGMHVRVTVESAIPQRWYTFRARVRGASTRSTGVRLQLVKFEGRFDEPVRHP